MGSDWWVPGLGRLHGNANLVIGGLGSQTVNGGTGSDVLRVAGTTILDATDVFAGGAGYDAIQFDNNASAGGFGGTVNLTNVTDVELFQITRQRRPHRGSDG